MNNQRWVAVLVMGAWLLQLAYLWPLPSQTAAEMTATFTSLGADVSGFTAKMEKTIWMDWAIRLLLALIGVFAGCLQFRKKEKWAWVYLASAVIYIAYFEVWIWLPFHMEPFLSGARIMDRASWLVGHPGLLYMTILFPLFLVAVGILASVQLSRRRPHAF